MKKSRPGPKIGQLRGGLRKKNHPKYRKSRRQQALKIRHPMPGGSGFLYLEASGLYLANTSELVVTVTSKVRPDNLGPGIFFKRTFEWHRHLNGDGSLPKKLQEVLQETANQVARREFPESGLFLERCNNTGQEVGDFLEEVCAQCSCWYCELAS